MAVICMPLRMQQSAYIENASDSRHIDVFNAVNDPIFISTAAECNNCLSNHKSGSHFLAGAAVDNGRLAQTKVYYAPAGDEQGNNLHTQRREPERR